MDKAGSDLRALLGCITYNLYTETGNPSYTSMKLKDRDTTYVVSYKNGILTLDGTPCDIIDVPKNVDAVIMS